MSGALKNVKGIQVDAITSKTVSQPIKLGQVEAITSVGPLISTENSVTFTTVATGPYGGGTGEVTVTVYLYRVGHFGMAMVFPFSSTADTADEITISLSGISSRFIPASSNTTFAQVVNNSTDTMGTVTITDDGIVLSNGTAGTSFTGSGTAGVNKMFVLPYLALY